MCIDLVPSKQSKLTDRQLISSRLFDDFGIGQPSHSQPLPMNRLASIGFLYVSISRHCVANRMSVRRLSVHSTSACTFSLQLCNYNRKLIMRACEKDANTHDGIACRDAIWASERPADKLIFALGRKTNRQKGKSTQ